ncbi:MAG: C-GCAxxG-C-C family protein [Candidatus Margulisiibacteriota bacterium]
MPINKAKNHYLGKGTPRLNCAQSVIKAFQEHFGHDDKAVAEFLACGSGNAPGGVCGAYYAARHLLEKKSPDKISEFDSWFKEKACSLSCKEIRQGRKLSCLGCVEKAAEFVKSSLR